MPGAGGRGKYRCVIADNTGKANAFFPCFIDIREGDSIVLFDAKAEVIKEHIEIQLPREGKVDISRQKVTKIMVYQIDFLQHSNLITGVGCFHIC